MATFPVEALPAAILQRAMGRPHDWSIRQYTIPPSGMSFGADGQLHFVLSSTGGITLSGDDGTEHRDADPGSDNELLGEVTAVNHTAGTQVVEIAELTLLPLTANCS